MEGSVTAAFLFIAALLVVTVGVATQRLVQLARAQTTLYEGTLLPLQHLGAVEAGLWELRGHAYKFLNEPVEKRDEVERELHARAEKMAEDFRR